MFLYSSVFAIVKSSEDSSYTRWSDELQQALNDAEMHMKEKCDAYFDEIKNEAIKV